MTAIKTRVGPESIKVLHISRADNQGGSARSAYKIHSGLRGLGVRSRMVVQIKVTNDPDVDYIDRRRIALRMLDGIGREVVDRLGLQYMYYPSSFALLKHPWFDSSDIVQLHNTHGGFFTSRALPQLSRKHPVVWRLSDMWPLTGHCAYSYECERWKTGCGSCPLLREYPPLTIDTTALLWQRKAKIYRRSRLEIVTSNTWMEGLLRESPLLSEFPIHRIPNGVDTKVFAPIPKPNARNVLGIRPDARVVLFVAHVAKAGTRKGGEHVIPTMDSLASAGIPGLVLVVVGELADRWPEGKGYETIRHAYTRIDERLALLYSAADVLIHPSLAENFPNSILEIMSCGTPAAAFDTGGVSDAVSHMETGYLAEYKDSGDLAHGVRQILTDRELSAKLSWSSRELVIDKYSLALQARRYADLYQELSAETESSMDSLKRA